MLRLLPLVMALALSSGCAVAAPVEWASVDAAVAEAADVVGLPARWIELVMDAESGRDPRARSRTGAIGLMQLMPATWRQVRAELGLGADPYDIHDNVLAGAAYLRSLYDLFGAPGFLAAYNAGPVRYAEHLAGRATLPLETRAYLARLAPAIAAAPPGLGAPMGDWRRAPLFAGGHSTSAAAPGPSPGAPP